MGLGLTAAVRRFPPVDCGFCVADGVFGPVGNGFSFSAVAVLPLPLGDSFTITPAQMATTAIVADTTASTVLELLRALLRSDEAGRRVPTSCRMKSSKHGAVGGGVATARLPNRPVAGERFRNYRTFC